MAAHGAFKATINRSNIYQSATHKKLAGKWSSKIDEDDREFIESSIIL
jgi:hypothetical protein